MPHQPPFDPERRQFFKTVALTAAALVVLPAFASADDTAPQVVYVNLGPDSQYVSTDWTRVVLPAAYDSEVIFVKPTQPGVYSALSARCTHHGCVVAFVEANKDFECPCHGGKFNDDGKNISGPPPTPLLTLGTKVDAKGHLLVVQPPKFVPHHRPA